MTSQPVYSPVETLKAFLKQLPDATHVAMSESAWEAVKEEAFQMPAPCQIMDVEGGERSFDGVAVMLLNADHRHQGSTRAGASEAPI